jgi:hypothetical protein
VERPAASTCPPCCHTLIMKRAQVKQYLIVIYVNKVGLVGADYKVFL